MTSPTDASHSWSCQVNGQAVFLQLPPNEELTLLDVLRDLLGITSPKNGCQPQAQCGCCTVLVDDKPTLACALKPSRVEGKSITTLEGLDDQHRHQISESFVRSMRRSPVRILHPWHRNAGSGIVPKESPTDS